MAQIFIVCRFQHSFTSHIDVRALVEHHDWNVEDSHENEEVGECLRSHHEQGRAQADLGVHVLDLDNGDAILLKQTALRAFDHVLTAPVEAR